MKFIFTYLILLVPGLCLAQTVDMGKMDKDIEVAENILATLLEQGSDQRFMMGRNEVEGSYKENYGVVFTVPSNRFHFAFVAPGGKNKDKSVVVAPEVGDTEGQEGEGQAVLKDAFVSFLTDYGHLISQLQASDRILVKTEQSGGGHGRRAAVAAGNWGGKHSTYLSAEVKKSDLTAFEKGSMSKEDLIKAITINESVMDISEEPQIEVFAAMLERLYDTDLSSTYYMSSQPSFERMKDFGLTYYLKVYSSYVEGDEYYMPTINRRNVSREERQEIVQGMYPKFVEGVKENILEYGHILKNVKPDEMLVLDIKLTQCDGCSMPKQIEISTKKSTIDDYRSGRMSKDEAIAAITVKDVN